MRVLARRPGSRSRTSKQEIIFICLAIVPSLFFSEQVPYPPLRLSRRLSIPVNKCTLHFYMIQSPNSGRPSEESEVASSFMRTIADGFFTPSPPPPPPLPPHSPPPPMTRLFSYSTLLLATPQAPGECARSILPFFFSFFFPLT